MSGPPAGGVRSRALGSRPFRLYFAGQVASASGTFVQQTAIGWLVLRLTGSAAELGLVLAAGGVPSLLFGPWGGTVADRINLRGLLIGHRRDQLGRGCRADRRLPRPADIRWFPGDAGGSVQRGQPQRSRHEQRPGGRAQTWIEGIFTRPFTHSPAGELEPNGARVIWDLMSIFRFDDRGRLVEEFVRTDNRSFLRQLGAEVA